MANFEEHEEAMLSESFAQRSDELRDSNFRRVVSRTLSATAIPMEPHDREVHNVLYGDAQGFAREVYSFCSSCVPGVMNPHTKVVQKWNKILACFCMVAIFVDPLFFFLHYVQKDYKCIVINWTMTRILVLFRSLNDVVYLLNILLQFRLAYVSPESMVVGSADLVDHPKEIALNYFRGYFFLDLFVVIPLPQILMLVIQPHYPGSSRENYFAKNLLLAAILAHYIPRLFRFLPLLIGQSPTGFVFESASANFIVNLLTFMPAGHVVGSLWYLFSVQTVNQCLQDACHNSTITGCMDFIDCEYGLAHVSSQTLDQWSSNANVSACLDSSSAVFDYGIYVKAVSLTTKTNVVNKYVYSLFWGFQQISTLAGNQTPSYVPLEVLFTMAIMGLGLLLFALLIGNIQNFLQAIGQRRREMQLRGRDAEQWMIHRSLPEDLRRRVRQVERYNWVVTRGVNEEMLLENMPEDLQRDIRRHLFKFIKKVRILASMDEPILDAIREKIRQKIYIKGSRILYQGDLVEKTVFVVRGKLESIGEDGTRVGLSEGDACGEELLRWYLEPSSLSEGDIKETPLGPRLLSTKTVSCLTNVVALSLQAADLKELAIHSRDPCRVHVFKEPYESPYWRSFAATRIQVAWKYRKKQQNRAASKSN